MAEYAEIADVETYFGPVPEHDVERVGELLDQAEALVGQRIPNLAERITAGRTTVTLVRLVVAEMVCEVLRNPEGIRQRSETVGPFSRSSTYGGTQTAGVVDPEMGVLTLSRRQRLLLGDRRGAVTVPAADPALARPLRDPTDERYRSDGYVWPAP